MTYKLKLLPIVYQDLRKAKKWYLEINTALGEDFKLKVNDELDYIRRYPKHYQKKYKELRQAIVARFPFTVYYLICLSVLTPNYFVSLKSKSILI